MQKLMKKLEKLREHEKSSEMRHQQSANFVSELKKANRYSLQWFHSESVSKLKDSCVVCMVMIQSG